VWDAAPECKPVLCLDVIQSASLHMSNADAASPRTTSHIIGDVVACGTSDGRVHLWSVASANMVETLAQVLVQTSNRQSVTTGKPLLNTKIPTSLRHLVSYQAHVCGTNALMVRSEDAEEALLIVSGGDDHSLTAAVVQLPNLSYPTRPTASDVSCESDICEAEMSHESDNFLGCTVTISRVRNAFGAACMDVKLLSCESTSPGVAADMIFAALGADQRLQQWQVTVTLPSVFASATSVPVISLEQQRDTPVQCQHPLAFCWQRTQDLGGNVRPLTRGAPNEAGSDLKIGTVVIVGAHLEGLSYQVATNLDYQ
jgi:hypothetical protein